MQEFPLYASLTPSSAWSWTGMGVWDLVYPNGLCITETTDMTGTPQISFALYADYTGGEVSGVAVEYLEKDLFFTLLEERLTKCLFDERPGDGAAFSPDGRTAVTVRDNGDARLFTSDVLHIWYQNRPALDMPLRGKMFDGLGKMEGNTGIWWLGNRYLLCDTLFVPVLVDTVGRSAQQLGVLLERATGRKWLYSGEPYSLMPYEEGRMMICMIYGEDGEVEEPSYSLTFRFDGQSALILSLYNVGKEGREGKKVVEDFMPSMEMMQ